jgi:hypothetical protein
MVAKKPNTSPARNAGWDLPTTLSWQIGYAWSDLGEFQLKECV